MLRKAFAIAAALGLFAAAQASFAATTEVEPKDVHWSFEGPFGRFDQEQLQRGYKVYHDVCSSCHAMHLMSYRNLGQPNCAHRRWSSRAFAGWNRWTCWFRQDRPR